MKGFRKVYWSGVLPLAVVGMLGFSGVAQATVQSGTVDLLTEANIRIDGPQGAQNDPPRDGSRAGTSVASAGDVNGDGRDDVIVGAPQVSRLSTEGIDGFWDKAGGAYVIFGRDSLASVDLASVSAPGNGDGFAILGATGLLWPAYNIAGYSVASAGDVNGDGMADVIVGAPGGGSAGNAWVVFGKRSTEPVYLNDLGAGGARIVGAAGTNWAGFSVAGGGDIDGRGRPDVIVGAPGGTSGGSAYVVFGEGLSARATADPPVSLSRLGTGGFQIVGAGQTMTGYSVSTAGDVNADGRDDLIVGAPNASNNDRIYSGSAYVVLGDAAPTDVVNLADLGTRGFRIDGVAGRAPDTQNGDKAGHSVAGVGDMNGDGRDDVIVGAFGVDSNGREDSGAAYVVYGQASPANIDLANLGGRGFRIEGGGPFEWAGFSVGGVGDVNDDGRPDVVVGVPCANHQSAQNTRTCAATTDFGKRAGSAYVVYGKTSTDAVSLAGIGGARNSKSFLIAGNAEIFAGYSVAGAGDVTGDGASDVIIAAPFADHNNRTDSGSVYVVPGINQPSVPEQPPAIDDGAKPPLGELAAIKLPSNRKCVSKRRFRIRIKRPDGIVLESGEVSLNGKQIKVLKKKILGKKRLTATVNLRGLKKGAFEVKISVVTSTGDTIESTRKYKTCRKGQKPKHHPKL